MAAPSTNRELLNWAQGAEAKFNKLAAALRRVQSQAEAPKDKGLPGLGGLPAHPGSVWSLFAKLAWADPDIVRPHSIPVETTVQGVAGADGNPVQPDTDVVAKAFFLVRSISAFVEIDPTNPAEANSPDYVGLQIEDTARTYPVFREAIRMSAIAGTLNRRGEAIQYDEYPLVFLPNSRILATFSPFNGFPAIASAQTGATTRRVGVHLHGVLVAERLVDRLIEDNRELLHNSNLLPR